MTPASDQFDMFTTARDTDERLTQVDPPAPQSRKRTFVALDEHRRHQTIEGFGGSFTESTAIALSRLSDDKRREVLEACFDPTRGHGYTLCRTHINSCDFSTGDWDYVDEGDTTLQSFSLDHDEALLFPLIRDASRIAGRNIKLVASPWSPPAWMKTNGDMKHGGHLKAEYQGLWATYMARYLTECTQKGFDMWGLTVQNEPQAVQVWESCIYSPEAQRDFVRDHLGPALHAAGHDKVRLMVWDHNKDELVDFCTPILSDPEAARYIWGVAFHWYSGDDFQALTRLHETFPDKRLLFTEGCMEGGVKLGSWDSAERYGHDIIGDLERWTVGWIDWNLALDETGGPNHVGNLCDAPIIADGTTNTVHYQSSYWYLGHFSRFIRPGAVRIESQTPGTRALETTAFLNPDNSVALVVMNRSDTAEPFECSLRGRTIETLSKPHSISTLVWR